MKEAAKWLGMVSVALLFVGHTCAQTGGALDLDALLKPEDAGSTNKTAAATTPAAEMPKSAVVEPAPSVAPASVATEAPKKEVAPIVEPVAMPAAEAPKPVAETLAPAPVAVAPAVTDAAPAVATTPVVMPVAAEAAPAAAPVVVAPVADPAAPAAPVAEAIVAPKAAPVVAESAESKGNVAPTNAADALLGTLLGDLVPAKPMPAATPAPVPEATTIPEQAKPVATVEAPNKTTAEPPKETTVSSQAAEAAFGSLLGDLSAASSPTSSASFTAPDAGREGLISELVTLEKLRRNALREHGLASLGAGRKALRDGDYEESKKQYEMALAYIPDTIQTRAARDEARDGVRESLYLNAVLLWKKGDREKAIQVARMAHEKGHPDAAKLAAEIQKEIDSPPPVKQQPEIHRLLEASYKDDRDVVMHRLQRARQYFVVGEYEKCRMELELVLRDHPSQTEAMKMLKEVNDRAYDVSHTEFETTRSKMIRDVMESWTPRSRYAIDTVQIKDAQVTRVNTGTQLSSTGLTPEQTVERKMKAIIVPEISFRNVGIVDAIKFFEDASREYDDPGLPPEKRGVNFVLKHIGNTSPSPVAVSATADPFAADASATAGVAGTPINLSVRFSSLWDALKIVTDVANLKFRIRGNIVMITPANMPDKDLEVRSYSVLSTLTERFNKLASEMARSRTSGGADAGGGTFSALTPPAGDTGGDKQDWKALFQSMGMEWPDGSSISYLETIGKLRVKNTSDNLAVFETLLDELNVTPRQIEIEARFVEVEQSDLDSLGVEWNVNQQIPLGLGTWPNTANNSLTLFPGLPTSTSASGYGTGTAVADPTAGLRYLTTGGGLNNLFNITPGSNPNDSLLSVHGIFKHLDADAILHMLSQRSNTDVLSAPKVVTKSGAEAVIKVVTEYIYPTTYEIVYPQQQTATITTGNQPMITPVVQPGGFETREVGVILQVVPEVSAEGQMINLTMNPQVVSEPDWHDYGMDMPGLDVDHPTHLPMMQPFFHIRSVSTSVSIYNGATVVMGGMITENRVASEDKIPFLGDIPYLGQLFRSKADQTDKRNLLIFVTARLVDPAGRTLKTTETSLSTDKMKQKLAPSDGSISGGRPE